MTTAAWVTAIATFAMAITAIIAAIVACKQLAGARDTRIAMSRPYMVARYLRPSSLYEPLSVEIANVGKTSARDLSFTFSPPLPSPSVEEVNSKCGENIKFVYETTIDRITRTLLNNSIDTWVPGHKVPYGLWTPFEKSDEEMVSAEGIPANQKLTIKYFDTDDREYSETYVLDALAWFGDVVQYNELEKIRKALNKIAGIDDN